jgi:histidinol-phosphate phosphatase family protein
MVAEAIKLFNEHDFRVVVITNQSGVGRGYFTEDMLKKIHRKMLDELGKSSVIIDAIYYCPHHPDDNCKCRKPKPTMILQAARDLNIDLQKSFFIGDSDLDIEAGSKAGCLTVHIATANGNSNKTSCHTPDVVLSDLYEAARWIIARAV